MLKCLHPPRTLYAHASSLPRTHGHQHVTPRVVASTRGAAVAPRWHVTSTSPRATWVSTRHAVVARQQALGARRLGADARDNTAGSSCSARTGGTRSCSTDTD